MYFHQHSVPHNCWAQSQWHSSLLHDSSHMDIKATCASNAMYKSLANLSKYWLAFKRHQGRTGSASAPRWWSMSHTGTGGTGTAAFFFTITISVAFFSLWITGMWEEGRGCGIAYTNISRSRKTAGVWSSWTSGTRVWKCKVELDTAGKWRHKDIQLLPFFKGVTIANLYVETHIVYGRFNDGCLPGLGIPQENTSLWLPWSWVWLPSWYQSRISKVNTLTATLWSH